MRNIRRFSWCSRVLIPQVPEAYLTVILVRFLNFIIMILNTEFVIFQTILLQDNFCYMMQWFIIIEKHGTIRLCLAKLISSAKYQSITRYIQQKLRQPRVVYLPCALYEYTTLLYYSSVPKYKNWTAKTSYI